MPILRRRAKKNGQIKQQQQQTLITSKNLCPFQKTKLNNKVKIASHKNDIKQNGCNSAEEMVIHQFIISLDNS